MTNPIFQQNIFQQNIFQQKQWVFDRWAPRYDWLFPSIFYQAVHQRLLTYVQLPDRPQVLDLGCGTGRLLNRLAAHFPDLQGTGFDLAPEMLRQARLANRHRPRLIFVQGNVENLPFADEQFDAIFNTISFLHYPNPDRALAEIQRVLKPGGQYYLADFTPSNWTFPPFRAHLPGNIQFYSPHDREQLGSRSGLQCLQHQYLLGPVLLSIFRRD